MFQPQKEPLPHEPQEEPLSHEPQELAALFEVPNVLAFTFTAPMLHKEDAAITEAKAPTIIFCFFMIIFLSLPLFGSVS